MTKKSRIAAKLKIVSNEDGDRWRRMLTQLILSRTAHTHTYMYTFTNIGGLIHSHTHTHTQTQHIVPNYIDIVHEHTHTDTLTWQKLSRSEGKKKNLRSKTEKNGYNQTHFMRHTDSGHAFTCMQNMFRSWFCLFRLDDKKMKRKEKKKKWRERKKNILIRFRRFFDVPIRKIAAKI